MTRRIVIAFVCAATIAAGVYLAVLNIGGRTRTVESILRKYQFTELSPPSTLSPPGTLVTVIKDRPLVVGVICPPSESLGDELPAGLLISDSSTSKEAEELTGSFSLAGGSKEQLGGEIDSKFVKKIAVTLSNVKLIEIPDSVVFHLIARRKDSCAKAIRFRQQNNQTISMIKSVIQANALYKIEFDGGLDATSRARITLQIASAMGLKINEHSEDTIEGNGLYWGVRDDESLATISPDHPPATGAAMHPRALPFDRSVSVRRDVEEPK